MIDRLKIIMEKEGLTPSQLADKLHIQRSGLSHILSGRNNPSLDFVKKILKVFPQYDMEWFIFGDTGVNNTIYKNQQSEKLLLFNDGTDSDIFPQQKPTRLKTIIPSPAEAKTENNKRPVDLEKTPVKQLVKVIMVYNNHTFEELRMED